MRAKVICFKIISRKLATGCLLEVVHRDIEGRDDLSHEGVRKSVSLKRSDSIGEAQ